MALPTFNGWNVVTLPLKQLRSVDFTDHDVVGATSSPWTGQTQSYDWGQAFMSATVTTTTLTIAQLAAWRGALRSARGPLNVFQFGDPSLLAPLGAAGTNLAPDPLFQMPLGSTWSQPDANWWIQPGRGYGKSNYLKVASTDSGIVTYSRSAAISVTAGQQFRVSCQIDASAVTAGSVKLAVSNAALSTYYVIALATNGSVGTVSATFTVPGGVTQVYISLQSFNAVFAAGKSIAFSCVSFTAGNPVVNGAGQAGFSLVTNGWPDSVANLLLPGDWLSLASPPVNGGDISPLRLFSVTQPVNSDASGNATLSLWPPLREVPATASPLILTNTQGLFRLAKNQQPWNVNYDHTGSLSFDIIEAL